MSWGEIVRVQLSIKLYIYTDDQGTFILEPWHYLELPWNDSIYTLLLKESWNRKILLRAA